MNAELITIGVLALFAIFLVAEVPIAVSLGLSGAIGIVALRSFDIASNALGSIPFTSISLYSLIVIPLYILLGAFTIKADVATRVYAVANRVFGKLKGGIGIATVAACAGFAAVSGSSVATAATIGKTSVGEMRRHGYNPAFAAGIVGIAATLGILIPPSVVLIFYGIISGESIAQLFAAGIIPGIISAVAYALTIMLLARRKGYISENAVVTGLAAPPRVTKSEALRSVGFIILIFTVILVGLFTGIVTTTESAAVAAVLGLGVLLYEKRRTGRKETTKTVYEALSESSGITSMSFAILIGASIFTFFLVSARVPYKMAEFLTSLDVPPLALVALILVATIPLGMFLDAMSILVIVVPLTYPTLMDLGFDGVWYGILLVKMIELSLITPPVGLNAFVIASASGLKVETVFRGLVPFMITELALVTVFLLFPDIVMFLPKLVAG